MLNEERYPLRPVGSDLSEEQRQVPFQEGMAAGRVGQDQCPYEGGYLVLWLRGYHLGMKEQVEELRYAA